MSTISKKSLTVGNKSFDIMVETYGSANEVARDCSERSITDSAFDDVRKVTDWKWRGVESYENALDLLKHGYAPTVEALKQGLKASKLGNSKRITFHNNIVGAAPIVPLAILGVPNNMIDMRMKPIKAKVIDVYYDITASWSTEPKEIIEAGQKLLGIIIALEQQGYKFNLYAVQGYADNSSCDMLCVRIKSSGQPIDLKRMSFPLTHVGFFRVIGFDWYSKCPKAKHRSGYGMALTYVLENDEKRKEFADKMFGKNSMYITCATIINRKDKAESYLKEVLTNGKA